MDPAQGETQGRSITSKLKAKVKGVKGKVHLPGHKKRHGDDGQANGGDSSDHSSDDSPKKPGRETGYNVGDSTPFTTVKTTPLSPAREKPSPNHEPHNRDYHSRPSHTTEGMPKMSHNENPSSPTKPREGVLGNIKDTVGGAAAAVGSKMGYYTEVDHTPVVQSPADPNAPNAPSVMDKAKASLGMDKPRDPNTPTLMEKTKATMGLDKPRDPNAPTLMEKTKATLGLGPSSPNSVTSPSQPGVIDRVSGAMSSLFTSSPKGSSTGEDVQHTFPAQSDYVPPAATVPHQPYGDRGGEERMTTTPRGDYNQTTNRY